MPGESRESLKSMFFPEGQQPPQCRIRIRESFSGSCPSTRPGALPSGTIDQIMLLDVQLLPSGSPGFERFDKGISFFYNQETVTGVTAEMGSVEGMK